MAGFQLQVLKTLDLARKLVYHFIAIVIACLVFCTDVYDLFWISFVTKLLGHIYYHVKGSPDPGSLPPNVAVVVHEWLGGNYLGTRTWHGVVRSTEEAESKAVIMAFLWRNVFISIPTPTLGDCKKVLYFANGQSFDLHWSSFTMLEDLKYKLNDNLAYKYIPRDLNGLADALAKFSRLYKETKYWFDVPSCISEGTF